MLALSQKEDESRSGGGEGGCDFTINPEEFPEFADQGNLLESFDFDDLFGDSLPDLEIDPEILTADFSDHTNKASSSTVTTEKAVSSGKLSGEEVVSKREDEGKRRKCSSKNGKRKVKVDWTPELHRRFVQAVEQLGVDKAVPSRILELMNIHCLTRHNVASHLQKYRCHRKHMVAREAEAAKWTRKRQEMYGGGAATMGFPHFRPLHVVWGHPKHFSPFFCPSDPPFCLPIPNGSTPGTPCFPAPPTRFGIPQPQPPPPERHHTVYKSDPLVRQSRPRPPPPLDFHPTKESVDAAIGDVLKKPWLPLPLGLKAPSVDSVMAELHRHGVSHVPPTAPCA